MPVSVVRQVSTTQMQVTSIRLERDLKEKLKELAGHQGYQTLIREVLWAYVQAQAPHAQAPHAQTPYSADPLRRSHICASVKAVAHSETHCALTGQRIQPQEPMLLGLTQTGEMVALSVGSLG